MKSAGPDSGERRTPRILIIAYGNPLRSDDGAAWHAAELLREECPSARIVSAHQLTPEFAEMAAESDGVLFLDAAQTGEPGAITCAEIDPQSDCSLGSHRLTPAQVLALCRQLYGATPHAMTVTIAGESFDHGDRLSETIRAALPALVDRAKSSLERLSIELRLPFQGSEKSGL